MSATSALENNEDLENVPLVRMEDVQPDRMSDAFRSESTSDSYVVEDEVYEGCIIKNEQDSNIEIEESLNTEEILKTEDDSSEELAQEEVETVTIIVEEQPGAPSMDSWPTLEILPGGVIQQADGDIVKEELIHPIELKKKVGEMIFACAKCPQRFSFLRRLVQHIRWHEEEKKEKGADLNPDYNSIVTPQVRKHCPTRIYKNKRKIMSKLKTKCKKVPKRT